MPAHVSTRWIKFDIVRFVTGHHLLKQFGAYKNGPHIIIRKRLKGSMDEQWCNDTHVPTQCHMIFTRLIMESYSMRVTPSSNSNGVSERNNQGVTEWALSLSLRQTPGYINFEIGRSKCRCYHILLSQ